MLTELLWLQHLPHAYGIYCLTYFSLGLWLQEYMCIGFALFIESTFSQTHPIA